MRGHVSPLLALPWTLPDPLRGRLRGTTTAAGHGGGRHHRADRDRVGCDVDRRLRARPRRGPRRAPRRPRRDAALGRWRRPAERADQLRRFQPGQRRAGLHLLAGDAADLRADPHRGPRVAAGRPRRADAVWCRARARRRAGRRVPALRDHRRAGRDRHRRSRRGARRAGRDDRRAAAGDAGAPRAQSGLHDGPHRPRLRRARRRPRLPGRAARARAGHAGRAARRRRCIDDAGARAAPRRGRPRRHELPGRRGARGAGALCDRRDHRRPTGDAGARARRQRLPAGLSGRRAAARSDRLAAGLAARVRGPRAHGRRRSAVPAPRGVRRGPARAGPDRHGRRAHRAANLVERAPADPADRRAAR